MCGFFWRWPICTTRTSTPFTNVLFYILLYNKCRIIIINIRHATTEEIGLLFRQRFVFSISFWSACSPHHDLIKYGLQFIKSIQYAFSLKITFVYLQNIIFIFWDVTVFLVSGKSVYKIKKPMSSIISTSIGCIFVRI